MANITEILNPLTPLAFLPPSLADQFEVSRYMYAGTVGAFIWDIGLNLGNDYTLLFKHRIRFPTVVYFSSRVFTFAYILTSFVFQVASVKDCAALQLGLGICLVLSQTSTAMLFVLRASAVWHPNKVALGVFILLWLAVLGAGITVPVGIRGAHIGPTMQCINTLVPANTEAIAIMGLINDSAIFLAINYRILSHAIVADSLGARLRVFLGGGQLSRLSWALVQSGQHFYLVALAANIAVLVLLKLPDVPAPYHAMLTIPAWALINAMACLVFRRIKFGHISSDGTTRAPTSNSEFHTTGNSRTLPLHHRRTDRRTDAVGTEFGSRATTAIPLDVLVQKETYRSDDKFHDQRETSKTATLT
ncbi:hypothetical protein C8R47DRAFT_1201462 [Mycena vitilis]|nr:hypothetical protein C8R47DRAFT_1201462 [Mycena vitilis]